MFTVFVCLALLFERRTGIPEIVGLQDVSGQGRSAGRIWSGSVCRTYLVRVGLQDVSSQGRSAGRIWSGSVCRTYLVRVGLQNVSGQCRSAR